MIPLKNLSPRRTFPLMTMVLIVANVIVFLHQLALGPQGNMAFLETYGLVPAKIQWALSGRHVTMGAAFTPFFTSMFLHGGILHILGNMWFLWIFGGNVEDRLGHAFYLIFYLICGLGSAATQTIFSWGSRVPAIGASGAISGVLGAYILFLPGSRILTLVPLFIIWFTAQIPALVFIGLWFMLQFLSGLGSLGTTSSGGVAWWAHVGGFVLGLLLASGVRSHPARYSE